EQLSQYDVDQIIEIIKKLPDKLMIEVFLSCINQKGFNTDNVLGFYLDQQSIENRSLFANMYLDLAKTYNHQKSNGTLITASAFFDKGSLFSILPNELLRIINKLYIESTSLTSLHTFFNNTKRVSNNSDHSLQKLQ